MLFLFLQMYLCMLVAILFIHTSINYFLTIPFKKSPYQGLMNALRGGWWLSGRVLDSRSSGCGLEPRPGRCVVSLSKTIYNLLNTVSTQEDLSPHD